MTLPEIDPALADMMRVLLALIFAQAGFHKFSDLSHFRESLAAYRLVPKSLSRYFGPGLPAFELLLSIALIARPGAAAALLAISLLSLYSTAIAVNLRRGRTDLDCGCGGPSTRQPIEAGLIVRNGVLMAAAAFSALPSTGRPLVWLDALPIFLGAVVLATLLAGFDTAMRNRRSSPMRAAGGLP